MTGYLANWLQDTVLLGSRYPLNLSTRSFPFKETGGSFALLRQPVGESAASRDESNAHMTPYVFKMVSVSFHLRLGISSDPFASGYHN
jgi:hypothetical protein